MASQTIRIACVAGEASGDYLGSKLIRAIRAEYPDVSFFGIAGPQMIAQGCEATYPMQALNVMGITEVFSQMLRILRLRKQFAEQLLAEPPDAFIGIDYPEFNIGLAAKLKRHQLTTIQYNSPKVWAWRKRRIHKIAKAIDLMLCLLPFECDIYKTHRIPVSFVGHPLADDIPLQIDTQAARERLKINTTSKPIIAILPGSRSHEVARLTPVFLKAAMLCKMKYPDCQLIIPMVDAARAQQFKQIKAAQFKDLDCQMYVGKARDVISAADVVLLASGTATLETMLCKKPMVVAYRLSAITYRIIKALIQVDLMALPNLLAGHELVPEFMQQAVTPDGLADALIDWLENDNKRHATIETFSKIHQSLQMDAGVKAAHAVIDLISKRRDTNGNNHCRRG